MVALEGGTDTPAPFHSALDGKDPQRDLQQQRIHNVQCFLIPSLDFAGRTNYFAIDSFCGFTKITGNFSYPSEDQWRAMSVGVDHDMGNLWKYDLKSKTPLIVVQCYFASSFGAGICHSIFPGKPQLVVH